MHQVKVVGMTSELNWKRTSMPNERRYEAVFFFQQYNGRISFSANPFSYLG